MTTIEEEGELVSTSTMNEFFDFDDAAQSEPKDIDLLDFSSSSPYDIDLTLTGAAADNSLSCLEPSDASSNNPIFSYGQSNGCNQNVLGADDFTNFPRWIDGMDLPTNPCSHCQRTRTHCKVIREGLRKGSCTSCVALVRSCSLTHNHERGLQRPIDVLTAPEGHVSSPTSCVYCRRRGLQCSVVSVGDKSCTNCIAFACPCTFDSNLENRPATRPPGLKAPEPSQIMHDANPKSGARFSRDSLRILRNWLSIHHSHPYPTEDEKEELMKQTGLNKTQVTNWLANARRRHKIRPPRSTSPSVHEPSFANGVDIPRRATPALETMNPLERWKHSPPEHDPASITDIAKAVSSSTLSSGRDSPYTRYGRSSDEGSAKSVCNVSSTSSLGTSGSSGGSFASAFSHKSHGSFGSFGSFGSRGRRRRRKPVPKPVKITLPGQLPTVIARTYQCTFCTETFKTKHDWQRHEKSLHLSLERWVCCPAGFSQTCSKSGSNQCVFCGLKSPSIEHAEEHNFSSCTERTIEERTFYRKDHLRQHLNLVHDVKFQASSMETWKVATPEIRSRCGFCGLVMESWGIRVDHLAEHFKGGKSMKDWKGDWGFDHQILDIVENGLPPYLIHDERNSMNPFEASKNEPADERKLQDMLKIGLVDFIHDRIAAGQPVTDEVLLVEARQIIQRWKVADPYKNDLTCWFCNLFMLWGTEEIITLNTSESSDTSRSLPWETGVLDPAVMSETACPEQRSLIAFVKQKESLGLTPTDQELQAECCRILDEAEKNCNFKCRAATDWFKYLVRSSTCWLRTFRRCAKLPRSSEMKNVAIRSSDNKSIDFSIHNQVRLKAELAEWVTSQLARDIHPTDEQIQRQARMIVYQNDDPWNQTAADDPTMLHLFKQQTGLTSTSPVDVQKLCEDKQAEEQSHTPKSLHWDLESTGVNIHPPSGFGPCTSFSSPAKGSPTLQDQQSSKTDTAEPLKYFLNDVNCYGRLVRELSRFVKQCMSPNNPAAHIPTDIEIQNHARLVIYSDIDPWNQTAADNAEWLVRFKRDVGLLPSQTTTSEFLPGLPEQLLSWDVHDGGSGFSPPFVMPCRPEKLSGKLGNDGGFVIGGGAGKGPLVEVKQKTFFNPKAVQGYVRDLSKRFAKPGVVFCSRDLENGLKHFLHEESMNGRVPTDQRLRDQARKILGIDRTAADDDILLAKFKQVFNVDNHTSTIACQQITATTPLYQPKPYLPTIQQSGPERFTPQMIPISAADKTKQLEAAFDAELGIFGHLPQQLDMDTFSGGFSSHAEPGFRTGTQLNSNPMSREIIPGGMEWSGDFDMNIDNFDVMNESSYEGIDFCGAPTMELGMVSGMDESLGTRQELSDTGSDQGAFRDFIASQGGNDGKGWEFEDGGRERIW